MPGVVEEGGSLQFALEVGGEMGCRGESIGGNGFQLGVPEVW